MINASRLSNISPFVREEPLYSPFCVLTLLWFPGYLVLNASAVNLNLEIAFRPRFQFKFGAGVFPLATSQSSTPFSHRLPSLKYNARLSSSLDRTPVPICYPGLSAIALCSSSHHAVSFSELRGMGRWR